MVLNSKIPIVHIVHSFGTGGMEKGIAMLINKGSDRFEHVVVCLTRSGHSKTLLNKDVRFFELHKPPGNSIRFIRRLSRLLKRLKPCIVHCRNWGGTDGIIAARLAGIRAVVQGEHGWDMGDQDGLNSKRIIARRLISHLVARYSCVSGHMHAWLLEKVRVKKPVRQIYNGIDTSRYCPGAKDGALMKSLGIRETDFVIGTVGRLDPIKNHPFLIDAFLKTHRDFPDSRLIVVGDGPEMPSLRKMVDDPSILMLGARDDVPSLMRLFDVYSLTSFNEGISNTILEAMASGLPVIATHVGGNPELIRDGKNGFLFESGDQLAFCKAMIRYMQDEGLRKRHGTAACRYVVENFSIERMTAGYEDMYLQLADETSLTSATKIFPS